MKSKQGTTPSVLERQSELAWQWFECAAGAGQRILAAQEEGVRRMLEIHETNLDYRDFGNGQGDVIGQWLTLCGRSLDAAGQVSVVCVQTASTVQIEACKTLEDFMPRVGEAVIDALTVGANAAAPTGGGNGRAA